MATPTVSRPFVSVAKAQWIQRKLAILQGTSPVALPQILLQRLRTLLQQIPSQSRVFAIPGVRIVDGAHFGEFPDCHAVVVNDKTLVYRGTRLISTFSSSASIQSFLDIAEYYASPNSKIPARFRDARPIDVVPQ